jgi:hypothetical protein
MLMERLYRAGPDPATRGCRVVESADGALRFTLSRVAEGLYVRRELRRPRTGQVIQAVVFSSRDAFARWRAADVLRFEHPLLHADLERAASEAFAALEPAGEAV